MWKKSILIVPTQLIVRKEQFLQNVSKKFEECVEDVYSESSLQTMVRLTYESLKYEYEFLGESKVEGLSLREVNSIIEKEANKVLKQIPYIVKNKN